jgi:fibronectin-binding autotransporter adhesin
MKRKSTSLFRIFGHIATRAASCRKLPALLAISTPFLLMTYQMQAAPAIQTGGNVSVDNVGSLDGHGDNGFFVQGGTLSISNGTLTNFSTAGGNGSGGGAGLGGAIFINSGASVTLTNVDIMGNTAKGGAGGIGSLGGTLNQIFSGGTTGTAGANGSTPTQSSYTDIGGTTGSKGYNGAFSATGFGGFGGDGGDGGNGGDRSDSCILATTSASLGLAGWVIQLAADSANPFTANVAIGLAASLAQAGIDLGSAIAANVYFDKSLADGQIGLGGGGGAGGNGGQGGFGFGGGAGGDGGDGGTGGKNWSGSAYSGGAAGGDANDGGTGGLGGFGAGGGQGGDGGLGGGGAGFDAKTGTDAKAPVTEDRKYPIYSQQYTFPGSFDPTYTVTVTGDLDTPRDPFTQLVTLPAGVKLLDGSFSDGTTTATVAINTVKTSERTVTFTTDPGAPAIDASSAGKRPDGLNGSGGDGGSGGFGGGSGAGGTGNATQAAGGSGGNGMGGGIFVRDGGALTITGNATIGQNIVRGGAGQLADNVTAAGAAGGAVGSDIFMMTGSSVRLAAGTGNVIKINGTIADDSAASMDSPIPSGSGAGLTIASGLVILNGSNTYSGETKITGGVLQAQDGTGINSDSHINFAGGVLQSNGDFTRMVGTDPSKVQWTGSGGFAAAGGVLNVSLNAGFSQAAATQTWASNCFVPDGSSLLFGSASATDNVNFKNNIDFNGGNRSILVMANAAMAATLTTDAYAANVDTATLTGVLSNGALTVGDASHTGILILTNSNTYAGGTTVAGGTLALARSYKADGTTVVSTGSLNANGVMNIAGGADLDISQTGNQAIGDLSGAGSVNLGGNILTINQAAASSFSGVLADGGIGGGSGAGIIKMGAGTLTLTGASTYTGSTLVEAGTLTLTGSLASLVVNVFAGATLNDQTSGLTSLAALNNDGTLNLNSDDTVASLVNTGTINNSAHTLTAATYALNNGSLINANLGTGTVTSNGSVALNGTSAAEFFHVQSGTTTLGSAERLLDSVDLTIDALATLTLGGNEKIGSLFGAGHLQNAGGRLTLDDGNFSGVISGSGGLTKLTTGNLILSGANTYSGSTLIDVGTLTLDGSLACNVIHVAAATTLINNAGGLSATATLTNDGTVEQNSDDTITALVNTGTINNSAHTLTAATYALNHGSLINANLGSGSLTANGSVALNGTSAAEFFHVQTGTTTLGSAERLLDTTDLTIDPLAILMLGGNEKIGSLFGGGNLQNAGFRLTLDDGAFAGVISGGGGLTKRSAGTLTLTGANTYTGSTVVDAGTLTLSGAGSLTSPSVNITAGATLNDLNGGLASNTVATVNGTLALTANDAIDTLLGSGSVTLAAPAILSVNQGAFAGGISGAGNLTKTSPGLLTLTGASTYTGTTLVDAGTLTLSGTGSLKSPTVNITAGATVNDLNGGLDAGATVTNRGLLNIAAAFDTIAALVNFGTINGTATLTAATYALNHGSLINANLGAGSLTANGSVALNGTSAAEFFHVQTGTTTLGAAERLLDTTALTIDAPATLRLGGDEKIGSLLGAGLLDNQGFRLTLDGGDFAGVIAGSGGLTKVSTDILKLSGSNTFSGSTLVDAGSLVLTGSLGSGSVVTADTASLTVGAGGSITGDSLTINGRLTVADSTSLHYTTLTGNGIIDNTGYVFVNPAGSTIKGFLTFTGGFTNLGNLTPGYSPGLTTIGGNYTEAGPLAVELETTTPITGHDQVRVGGSVTLQASSSLIVQTYNNVLPARGSFYQVLAGASGTSIAANGTFDAVRFDADGALGAGAAVVNAAAVFDQATGRVLATGLNSATSTFADLGASTNQRRAASALFTRATTGLVGPNQINTTTVAGALAQQLVTAHANSPANLARFTPEFCGAMADYAFGNHLAVTNLLHERVSALTSLPGTTAPGFSLYSGVMQQQADTADHADIDRTDIYLGGDYAATKDVSLGLLVTQNNGDIGATYGSAEVDGTGVDVYLKQSVNPRLSLVGRLGYGVCNYDLHRSTTDTVQALGETDSAVFTGSLGASYLGWSWGELSLAPRLDLTYSHAAVDGFTETGANDRLELGSYDASRLLAQCGASLVWATKLGGRAFSTELNVGIAQCLSQSQDDQQATLVRDSAVSFNQTFADDDATSATYGLRFGYSACDNATIYAGYEGRAASNTDGNFNAGIRVSF